MDVACSKCGRPRQKNTRCNPCRNKDEALRRAESTGQFVPCTKCGIQREVGKKCAACVRAYNAAFNVLYYPKNSERIRARSAAWYRANKTHVAERGKRYRLKNFAKLSEQGKLRCKEWRKANPERSAEQAASFRRNNPDAVRAIRRRYYAKHTDRVRAQTHTRRVRLLSAMGSFTEAEINAIRKKQHGKCAYASDTSVHHTHKLTIDHKIPISRGGSNYAFNLQLLCGPCNSRKHARLMANAQYSLFDNI